MHERSLADEMHYSDYHQDRLDEIALGGGNLTDLLHTQDVSTSRSLCKSLADTTQYKDSSVHAFIDKKTGEVYMPAGYNAPTRTGKYPVRWDLRIIKDKYILNPVNCGWAGGYLYDRSHLPSKYI